MSFQSARSDGKTKRLRWKITPHLSFRLTSRELHAWFFSPKCTKSRVVETKEVLASVGYLVTTSSDKEAVEFLISSAIAKIWKHAFYDERTAIAQVEQEYTNEYSKQVGEFFLEEYRQAKELVLPVG